jgi:hypothetical protein
MHCELEVPAGRAAEVEADLAGSRRARGPASFHSDDLDLL